MVKQTIARFATLFITIVMVNNGQSWELKFTPHALNVGVQLVTQCFPRGRLTFSAIDYVQITPEDSLITMRRQQHPGESKCTAVAFVFRNNDGGQGDPDKDYIGESSSYYMEP